MNKIAIATLATIAIFSTQPAHAVQTTTYMNLGTGCGYASSSRAADPITTLCSGLVLADFAGGIVGTNLDVNWGVDLSKTAGVFSQGMLDVTLPDGRTLSCSNFSGTANYPTATQIAPVLLRTAPVYNFSLDGTCTGIDTATEKSFTITTHQDGSVRYQLIPSRRIGTKLIPGGVVWSLWDTGGSVTISE